MRDSQTRASLAIYIYTHVMEIFFSFRANVSPRKHQHTHIEEELPASTFSFSIFSSRDDVDGFSSDKTSTTTRAMIERNVTDGRTSRDVFFMNSFLRIDAMLINGSSGV